MHRHLRVCGGSHRNTGGSSHLYAATEDVEDVGHHAVGMSFSSDGTESMIVPQSSHPDTEPHCCMLHTSGASCTCSGIATSGMLLFMSVSLSGLSCTAPGAAGVADAGCGHS